MRSYRPRADCVRLRTPHTNPAPVRHRPFWLVVWDNGAGACGEFPYEFDSFDAADTYGRDWANECNARDGIEDDDEGYSYEVIEKP